MSMIFLGQSVCRIWTRGYYLLITVAVVVILGSCSATGEDRIEIVKVYAGKDLHQSQCPFTENKDVVKVVFRNLTIDTIYLSSYNSKSIKSDKKILHDDLGSKSSIADYFEPNTFDLKLLPFVRDTYYICETDFDPKYFKVEFKIDYMLRNEISEIWAIWNRQE